MFKFRLQRVLELREKAEQAKARALASAQDAAEVAHKERAALATLHAESRASIDDAQRAEPRIGHLQQLGYVLQSLDERLETAGESVRAADDMVVNARKSLEGAARDRRVLDRLKGRHVEQWRNEETQKDRIGMDEIALARFSRSADAKKSDDAAKHASPDSAARGSTMKKDTN